LYDLHAGVRYGQAPALLNAPEAQELLAAVADSLDVRGGTRLAAATGECLGYLLETLTRLSNAPAPGAMLQTMQFAQTYLCGIYHGGAAIM
jgi:hypothetical protein